MLEQKLLTNHKKSLRDIGSLLDNPDCKEKTLQVLKDYTLFKAEEIKLNKQLTRQQFLDFYYKNQSLIQFSPLWNVYYITPPEQWKVEHQLKKIESQLVTDVSVNLRKYSHLLEQAIQEKEEEKALEAIDSLASIPSPETGKKLLEILTYDYGFSNNKRKLIFKILNHLVDYPTKETLTAVLKVIEKEKEATEDILHVLALLTNIKLDNPLSTNDIVRSYQHYLDSLGNLKSMRSYGYNRIFNFRKNFFQFPIDYYGKLLSYSNAYPWIQFNALKDIQKQANPRALNYIAAQIYHYRHEDSTYYKPKFYVNLLRNITGMKIAIKDSADSLTLEPDLENDDIAMKNFSLYWAGYYEDYEWDDVRQRFINKHEAVAQTEKYERWFRRLNSTNDSVAWESYIALTQGDPIEVAQLAKKYKDLLRSYNKSLPSLKSGYLEQLAYLTDFCRRNDYAYEPNEKILSQLEILSSPLEEKERFFIENQLINHTIIDSIAVLEYWGLLYANNRDFTFSIGRILEWLYVVHWQEIVSDEQRLRFYLKKGWIFAQIGVIGSCNQYLNIFEKMDSITKSTLQSLLVTETDKDIVLAIQKILSDKKEILQLEDFLDDPLSVSSTNLKNLAPPLKEEYPDLFMALQMEENPKATKTLASYIQTHAQKDMIPELMRLLQMEIATNEVNKILNTIYDIKENKDFWMEKWYADNDNFRQWDKLFFEEKMNKLRSIETLSIKDINAITESVFYHDTLKTKCLEALQKVKPIKNIRRLKHPSPLSTTSDLKWFKNFEFSYKSLDDIPKLFDTKTNTDSLVHFLYQKSSSFPIDEKGSFCNSLFRSAWFSDYINNGKLNSEKADSIKSILSTYLQTSDLISEFEEQATIQNIVLLENLGKPLKEKLQISYELPIDDAAKAKIQEAIISRVSYEQIPEVMADYDRLSPAYRYNFLNQDFGLPIFELDNVQVHQQLIKNHQKLNAKELYRHYLIEFGVDFLNEKGQLDYQKIDKILQLDIVTPFVNGGGSSRDFYVYGLIKLLEFEFNTKLGFHEKLNENQTFYSYSAKKRVEAWRQFLRQEGIVGHF